jgi:hypothetical protein
MLGAGRSESSSLHADQNVLHAPIWIYLITHFDDYPFPLNCSNLVDRYRPARRTCCLRLQGTALALLSRRPRQSEPPKRRSVTIETRDVTFQKSSSVALCCVFLILRACHMSHPSHPSRTGHIIGICSSSEMRHPRCVWYNSTENFRVLHVQSNTTIFHLVQWEIKQLHVSAL